MLISGLVDAGAEATLGRFGTLVHYVLQLLLLLAELVKVRICVGNLMAMSLLFKCDAAGRFSRSVLNHILSQEIIVINLITAVI